MFTLRRRKPNANATADAAAESAITVDAPAFFSRMQGHAADGGGAPTATAAPRTADAAATTATAWRERLDALRADGRIDDALDAALHRLLAAHEDELHSALPPLLETFRQATQHGYCEHAQRALTAGVQAIKDRQRAELLRLLDSIGDTSALRV